MFKDDVKRKDNRNKRIDDLSPIINEAQPRSIKSRGNFSNGNGNNAGGR